MPKLIVTTRVGQEVVVEARSGTSVMEALRDSGIDEVLAICGGCCSCATCHVYIREPWLDRVGASRGDEAELLSESTHRKPNSRLSCQIVMVNEWDGLALSIAPED